MNKAAKLIEQILLLRCQIGDRDALAELIDRYSRPLRYFINRLLGSNEMAEDVFQDTWLTVIRRIQSLKEVDAFPTWLYRIARNKVYQRLRKRKNLSELNENITVPNDDDSDVFSLEDAAELHKCLEKLRPEHKEVLMLRFLGQMSYEGISQVINRSVGTVRSRIHYAKCALRKEMEK
jgi:RNA polymerase sigma-70 factor (ECF subfamily)